MIRRFSVGLLLLFLLPVFEIRLSAQIRPFVFDHLTVDEGLSQSTVFAITKDRDGFLWFGTRDGLTRYDSRHIKVYRNDPDHSQSISGNSIQCFFHHSDGSMWIGTSEGISIYNATFDNFTQSKLDPEVTERLSNNHVTSIVRDSNGSIWVGTHGGLNRVISENPLRYQHFNNDPDNDESLINDEVRALYIDREGTLWIGTSIGISKMEKVNGNGIRFKNYFLQASHQKAKSWINCIAEDDDGSILVGTEEQGVKILNKETGSITSLRLNGLAGRPIESVRVIERNGNHEFWLGTIDGLYIYNNLKHSLLTLRNDPEDNTSLSDNSVRSIYMDDNKTYWIGTFYGGVNIFSPLARQFGEVSLTNKRNQKAFKVAGAMVTDSGGNLWVSTDGTGLYCLDPQGRMIRQYKHDPSDPNSISHNKIKTLLLDNHGLWIGTINGLNYLDFNTGRITHFFNDPNNPSSLSDDRIYDVKKDAGGNLWIATYRGGLCRYDSRTRTFERFSYQTEKRNSLSSNGVTTVYEDSRQNLWIGTISGLNRKIKSSTTFEHFGNHVENNPDGGGDYILCIFEDSRKNLWIGTRDTGLKRMDLDGNKVDEFNVDDGLAGNNVSGIQEDDNGYLWISTDNGLSRLDLDSVKFKNYNKRDGLACNEFNFNSYHKDRDGFLYFGGYNGIVKFHPDSIKENNRPPAVIFTKLKIFNQEVPIDASGKGILSQSLSTTETLTFNHRQNVFSVEFSALSFINASKNRFAYRLKGFEEEWNYVNEPVATYMNLEPGDYSLLAMASNNDGHWTSEPIQLTVRILPPPWKTWWAYTIYVITFLGLLLALIRFNKMRWRLAHDLELEHLEKEQQEKLHRAKLNFFTNIAHEIRTPLTLIISPVEAVEEKYPSDPFLQRQLRIVKSNTTRLMRLINQLLDFQKQESGNLNLKIQNENIVELLKEIVFSFTEHAHSRHIQLQFLSHHKEIMIPFDRDELEKVFCNLLHNAFKFTPGGGKISVDVSVEDEVGHPVFAKIQISDTGIGIPAEDLPKIFNRFFQAEHPNISESGFGIGLALAKGIIQLHGGTISVESIEADSAQSGFTKFTIMLPVSIPEIEQNREGGISFETEVFPLHNSLDAMRINGSAPRKHGRPLILLVEDNEEIRSCIKTILIKEYEIIEANNGNDAWDLVTERLPDIVISDIAMPGMDGLEFTKLVKNDERTDHIPVVLLTARGSTEHHMSGVETGADDYITKPFHGKILSLKIKNLLATRARLKEKYHRVVTLEPQPEELEDPENKFLSKLRQILDENLNDPEFNVSRLAREIGMSRPVLFRKIKMLTGLSVVDLIRSTRLKKAGMLLKQKKLSVSEVAFTVGFNDPKYFSKSFRAQFGKTPTEYMESNT